MCVAQVKEADSEEEEEFVAEAAMPTLRDAPFDLHKALHIPRNPNGGFSGACPLCKRLLHHVLSMPNGVRAQPMHCERLSFRLPLTS